VTVIASTPETNGFDRFPADTFQSHSAPRPLPESVSRKDNPITESNTKPGLFMSHLLRARMHPAWTALGNRLRSSTGDGYSDTEGPPAVEADPLPCQPGAYALSLRCS
jgi:hypothetical protein